MYSDELSPGDHLIVTNIDLSSHKIGDEEVKILVQVIRKNMTVTNINLSWNEIEDKGIEIFAKALEKNLTVINIDLSANAIKSRGAEALAQLIEKNSIISTINLSGNRIEDEGAVVIAKALNRNVTITSIDLSTNGIEDRGATAIAEALENNLSIIEANLSYNNIKKLILKKICNKVIFNLRKIQNDVRSLTKRIMVAESIDHDDDRTELVFMPSDIKISLEDYKRILSHKEYVNSWLSTESKNLDFLVSRFWQELELAKNTNALEESLFSLLNLPKHNVIVSSMNSNSRESRQLYSLFTSDGLEEHDIKSQAAKLAELRSSYVLAKENEHNRVTDFDKYEITTIWEKLINYAGERLKWSTNKIRSIQQLDSIKINADDSFTVEALKGIMLFHSLYPEYSRNINLLIIDYTEEIFNGILDCSLSYETDNLIKCLSTTLLTQETKNVTTKMLKYIYHVRPELFAINEQHCINSPDLENIEKFQKDQSILEKWENNNCGADQQDSILISNYDTTIELGGGCCNLNIHIQL